MSVSKIATTAIMALSLVAVPTLASAAPAASKLSVTAPTGAVAARAGAQVNGKKAVGGPVIIALFAGVAVIVGIIIASSSNKAAVSR